VTRLSLVLLLVLMASAMWLVKTSYEARQVFANLEKAKAEERQLAADAVRLEAEERTESTHLRIEKDAREKLNMRLPTPDVTMYVNDANVPGLAQPAASAPGGRP
jgi:cell division protein FtsL